MTERTRRTDDGTYPDAGEELAKLEGRLLPQASDEVAGVVENARRVVASRCTCQDCVAIVDRAIANLCQWRELLARKRGT